MGEFQSGCKKQQHVCIVNIGAFRSGTTTLAEAAERLGLKAYRMFPILSQQQYKLFLLDPEKVVLDYWVSSDDDDDDNDNDGAKAIINVAAEYDIICDGWISLLPFLPPNVLERFQQEAQRAGVQFEFVASTRDIESTVQSELQHWTIHDLEHKAGITTNERERLEHILRERAVKHKRRVQHLHDMGVLKLLPLTESIHKTCWSKTLSLVSECSEADWSHALRETGTRNANPALPVEGILLTMRLGGSGKEKDEMIASIEGLLDQIESDSLCRYLVVLGIDADEEGSDAATELIKRLETRAGLQKQLQSFHHITNPPPTSHKQPFPICLIWNEMAIVAWENGADWVVLLGDDIEIGCSYHYRALYRSFLDIAKRLKVPFGFGCPWWNDTTFPGFPSFPCVGKAHFEIFEALIPMHRRSNFVNQDLDPYLQHLYLKFMAAPCVTEALLSNGVGGNIGSGQARYDRVQAEGWRDFVLDDTDLIRQHIPNGTAEAILLDVIVPSYRVRLDYLASICSLKQQRQTADGKSLDDTPERILEKYLSQSGNYVRVRCNKTNIGASASRNRGLDESAADFVLHLDDDLVPNCDLLAQYSCRLQDIDDSTVGLVGLVRFPRSSTLPLRHAAVLMSYLTFMFEIAERNMYTDPAWGVTANILFRRTSIRFDLAYAKTGGGEDVDYSLRVTEACNGGRLLAVPEAWVEHPFWPGSVLTLSMHFFSWAIGDGALFKRFPQYCYWSFPNVPETLLLLSPFLLLIGPWKFLMLIPCFLALDFLVDVSNRSEYKHRCLQLQGPGVDSEQQQRRSRLFYIAAHVLANLYVIVLECGRIWGHIVARGDPWHGLCHRFDWHCGRLVHAPRNFRRREAYKFTFFVVVTLFSLFLGSRSYQINQIQSCFRSDF